MFIIIACNLHILPRLFILAPAGNGGEEEEETGEEDEGETREEEEMGKEGKKLEGEEE